MKFLDVGCGNKKQPGAVGIDINSSSDADIIHDLNNVLYLFEDSLFDEIIANNVIEHLDNVIIIKEELSRIRKVGVTLKIIVFYFCAKWADIDPTHRHYFTVDSFAYFDPDHIINKFYKYSQVRFNVKKSCFQRAD